MTLCVLFGVLLWVSGGGLDIQPSSSSALDDFRRSSGEGGEKAALIDDKHNWMPCGQSVFHLAPYVASRGVLVVPAA